jgi:SAM-dependent methyltransferase
VLSLELFGEAHDLPDFPTRADIVGIGLSDWEGYAGLLAEKLSYTNTYFDREPQLDITAPPSELEGQLDFMIASDVFEHVVAPITKAFENSRRLLKPTGVLVFTAPYGPAEHTVEHFPELHDHRVEETPRGVVLHNVTTDGRVQTFEHLIFHGGVGATLEMRSFGYIPLMNEFRKAGFRDMTTYDVDYFEHGIYWRPKWSLPIAARPG